MCSNICECLNCCDFTANETKHLFKKLKADIHTRTMQCIVNIKSLCYIYGQIETYAGLELKHKSNLEK